VLLVALLVSQGAQAAEVRIFKTGNALLELCESINVHGTGYCLGYIVGVTDASKGKTFDGVFYCIPKEVTAGQLKKVVTKHLNKHPEGLNLTAHGLVQEAFDYAFPCED